METGTCCNNLNGLAEPAKNDVGWNDGKVDRNTRDRCIIGGEISRHVGGHDPRLESKSSG